MFHQLQFIHGCVYCFSLQEECGVQLTDINMQISYTLPQLVAAFSTADNYLSLLARGQSIYIHYFGFVVFDESRLYIVEREGYAQKTLLSGLSFNIGCFGSILPPLSWYIIRMYQQSYYIQSSRMCSIFLCTKLIINLSFKSEGCYHILLHVLVEYSFHKSSNKSIVNFLFQGKQRKIYECVCISLLCITCCLDYCYESIIRIWRAEDSWISPE